MFVCVSIKSNLDTIAITLYWSSFLWAKMPDIPPMGQKLFQSLTMSALPFPRLLLTGSVNHMEWLLSGGMLVTLVEELLSACFYQSNI